MKRYVLGMLGLTAMLCTTAGVLNWATDPFGGWGRADAQGPDLAYGRIYQAHAAGTARPEAIIAGTSRSQIGLDAEHPALRASPRFVVAASGQPASESAAILEQLASQGALRLVVWGLDDLAFSCGWPVTPFEAWRWNVSDRLRMLFKLVTVEASLRRLLEHASPAAPMKLRADGGVDVTEAFVSGKGHHALTVGSEADFYGAYRRYALAPCSDPVRGAPSAHFQKALRIAHANALDVHLLISPAHARKWEVLHAAGAWHAWESWKRELVRINEEEAKRAGREAFPLWDFSGYNRYTTEPFPEASDKHARMRWYWESSHYKKELGDLVLDRVFGYAHPGRSVDPDFGVLMRSANIESHLEQIREERVRWLGRSAQEAVEIQEAAGKKAQALGRTIVPLAASRGGTRGAGQL